MTVDWFFDFISPFAYLQLRRFDELPEDVEVRMVPLLFAGILGHWEQRGPAEIAPKRTFTYRYVTWLARRRGIELRLPETHPFNPLPLLRLALVEGVTDEKVRRIFDFVWREGKTPESDEGRAMDGLAQSLGISDWRSAVQDREVKAELKDNTEMAIRRGVFGVPTFAIDDAVIWGDDATPMVVDLLNEPELLRDPAFARAASLPSSAQRKA